MGRVQFSLQAILVLTTHAGLACATVRGVWSASSNPLTGPFVLASLVIVLALTISTLLFALRLSEH